MSTKSESKVIFDLSYMTLSGTILPPLSVISGIKIQIHEVIDCLVRYYFPKCKSIWDPTCGTENHQFKDYLVEINGDWYYHGKIFYFPTDVRKTKWSKMLVDLFRPPYPFRDEVFDLIVYDPPFIPMTRTDKRADDYDISEVHSPLYIKKFYSEDVIKEFHRVCRQGVILRGQDFYYPPISDNLFLWLHDIIDLEMLRKYFKIVAVHAYRFFHTAVPLIRTRIGRGLMNKGYRRAMVTHSYLLIGYKKRT